MNSRTALAVLEGVEVGQSFRPLAIGGIGPFLLLIATMSADARMAARVCVDVSAKDNLEGVAFATLRAEASRIWSANGVELQWVGGSACDDRVLMVFSEQELRRLPRTEEDTLAVTVFSGHKRTIYVSLDRAFRMLLRSRGRLEFQTADARNLLGGTLLGRVVAHELGHALLRTLSHSSEGLMRPIVTARDLLSSADSGTTLSADETARLAMRFSLLTEPTQVASTR